MATPIAKVKKTEKDTEIKMTSSKPSSQRRSGRKKKEPSLESEQEEESTKETGSFERDKEGTNDPSTK